MLRESRCLKAQDADLLLLDLNDKPRICQIRSESGAPPVCSIQTQMSAVELVPFLRGCSNGNKQSLILRVPL